MFICVRLRFRSEMNSRHADKSVTTSNIRKLLPNVLPNDLPSYIKHKIVKKRIHFLRTEFEWLLDDIRRCSNDDAEVTSSVMDNNSFNRSCSSCLIIPVHFAGCIPQIHGALST